MHCNRFQTVPLSRRDMLLGCANGFGAMALTALMGDRAFGEPGDAVAADVVGRDHGLAPSHQHAQSDIIAFRALGFLDASFADLHPLRNVAHRDRVGGVRARAFGGLNETLRQQQWHGQQRHQRD